jgi:hypothetical protein
MTGPERVSTRDAPPGLDAGTERELRRMAVLYRRALLVAVSRRAQPPRPAPTTVTRTGPVRESPRANLRITTAADAEAMTKELPAG